MAREIIAGTGYNWTGGKELLSLAKRRAELPLEKRIKLTTDGRATKGVTILTKAVSRPSWR